MFVGWCCQVGRTLSAVASALWKKGSDAADQEGALGVVRGSAKVK